MPTAKAPRRRPTRKDAQQTRNRLMLEAGKAFAAQGYEGANLRNICKLADVNLGAVKYYFGSKRELYREALIQPHLRLIEEEEPPGCEQAKTPEEALQQWVRYFLRTILVRRREHPYLARLFIREIVSPTFALEELIALVFQKVRGRLVEILAALMAANPADRQVGEMANLIILLCAQQEMARPILERIDYPPPHKEADVKAQADKIYRFVLAGMDAWR